MIGLYREYQPAPEVSATIANDPGFDALAQRPVVQVVDFVIGQVALLT